LALPVRRASSTPAPSASGRHTVARFLPERPSRLEHRRGAGVSQHHEVRARAKAVAVCEFPVFPVASFFVAHIAPVISSTAFGFSHPPRRNFPANSDDDARFCNMQQDAFRAPGASGEKPVPRRK